MKRITAAIVLLAWCAALGIPCSVASAGMRTVAITGGAPTNVTNDLLYTGFVDTPVINNQGQVAFNGRLDGASPNSLQGIFLSSGSSTQSVALEGDAPFGGAETFSGFDGPYLNHAGEVAFQGVLTGAGVNFLNKAIIAKSSNTGLSVLVRAGNQVPEAEPGVNFFDFSGLRFNNLGQVVFTSIFNGPGLTNNTNEGLYAYQNGLREIVREGDAIPQLASEGIGNFIRVGDGTLNEAGEVAFNADFEVLDDNFHGWSAVFKEHSTGVAVVARRLMEAPESGGNAFSNFTPPSINTFGEVAFYSVLTSTFQPVRSGIYGELDQGGLQPIALRGDPVGETGLQIDGITVFGTSNEAALINDNGVTAFASHLVDDWQGATVIYDGIFTAGSDGLQLVVREGEAALGLPIGFVHDDLHNGSDRPVFSINKQGQVAFISRLSGPAGVEITGLFAQDEQGEAQLIVRNGSLLDVSNNPAMPDWREVTSFKFTGGSGNGDGRRSAFNDRGEIAFTAHFTDGSSGVFVSNTAAYLAGDYNDDGMVDAADYTVWRDNEGAPAGTIPNDVDGGVIGIAQYNSWVANFGATATTSTTVPEPSTAMLILLSTIGLFFVMSRSKRRELVL